VTRVSRHQPVLSHLMVSASCRQPSYTAFIACRTSVSAAAAASVKCSRPTMMMYAPYFELSLDYDTYA